MKKLIKAIYSHLRKVSSIGNGRLDVSFMKLELSLPVAAFGKEEKRENQWIIIERETRRKEDVE